MLTIASQFDLVSRLLAVVAAIFSVRAMRRHLALTHRMGAFPFDIGHATLSSAPLYSGFPFWSSRIDTPDTPRARY